MAHTNIVDSDFPQFEINVDTRAIKNNTPTKIKLMQYDHDSERFSFIMPRYIEGHDMMECNKVEVHYINVAAGTKEEHRDLYVVSDMAVDETDENKIRFSWLISQNATQLEGSLTFLIRFACVQADGTIDYAWNTDKFTGISVSSGIYNSEAIVEEYADVLAKWEAELFAAEVVKDDQMHAEYGAELVTEDGWTTDGWSGSVAEGFTHLSGNTNPLIFQMPEATGTKLYQISFKSSVAMTTSNLFVTLGGSDAFELYGQPYNPNIGLGIRSVQDGNLEFIPASSFTGTLSEISVKEIVGAFDGVCSVVAENGATIYEVRATKSDETESGTTGTNNVFAGKDVGGMNTSGAGNVGFGVRSLMNNTSGFWNVGVGYKSLKDNTAGSRNIAIGYIALGENVTGTRNVAVGTFALNHNKKGYKNIAIGADSQDKNIDGYCNVAVGVQSLYANENGFYNVAVGDSALVAAKANYNTAVGYRALAGCTTGNNNVGLGYQAGSTITTGSSNLAIGTNSLYKLKTGLHNIGIGSGSGRGQNTTAGFNHGIFIGNNAGYNLADNANYNIMIGYQAGHTTTSGTNNILIGKDAYAPTATQSNWLNIGGLVQGRMGDVSASYARIEGTLEITNLATSDPGIAGRLWNDNGTVKVSAG